MAVLDTSWRFDYDCNGATTVFPFPAYFLEDDHLAVLLTLIADGSFVPLVLGSGYAVSGAGNPAGGSITTTATYSSAYRISILRDVPLDQSTDYVEGDPFPAEDHERALDKLTMIVQQQQEQLDRSPFLPRNTVPLADVPVPVEGTTLGWVAGAWAWVASASASLAINLLDSTSALLGDALVIVKSTLTGGVARTQHDKNTDVVSVKDFGALGDGSDATTAIQAALDSGATEVHVPYGSYTISNPGLVLPSGVRLLGAGSGTPGVARTLLVAADATVTRIIRIDGTDNEVSGFMIYGDATNAVIGIDIGLGVTDSAGRIKIKGVIGRDLKWAFHVQNGAFLLNFEDCVAWNGLKGWYFDNTGALLARGCNIATLKNCHTVSNSEHGVYAITSNCLRLVNCGFDSDAIGVQYSASWGSVRHCTSDTCTTTTFLAVGSYVDFEDCSVFGSQLPWSIQDGGGGPSVCRLHRCRTDSTVGSYSATPATTSILTISECILDKAIQNDGERFNHQYRTEHGVLTITATGGESELTKAITFSRAFSALKSISVIPEANYTNRINTMYSSASASGFTARFQRDDGGTWNAAETQNFCWSATGAD